jgi:hypothetical protein
MAQWRLRDPGSFPPLFHTAMREGPGEGKIVAQTYTKRALDREQVEWQLFRFSLRHYDSHPSSYWEARLVHRTSKVWNEEKRMWELLLTSRRKVLEDLAKMSQLL